MNITRRQFLKYSGAGAMGLAAVPLFDRRALAGFMGSPAANAVGILIDTTKCIGCRACQLACKAKNNLPEDASSLPPNRTFPIALSETTFSLVEFHRVGGSDQNPQYRTVKRQCMHCLEPACASVCPVAAITKTEKGPVVYDAEKCMGCRYCMAACPFNVPKFEWTSSNPRIRKCTMCADRIEKGLQPACVEACPTGANHVDTANGNVRTVDAAKCIGCERCIAACPFTPSRVLWNNDEKHSQKCDLCTNTPFWSEKGGIGGKQACIEYCPMKAIKFTDQIPAQTGDTGYQVNLRQDHPIWAKLGFPTSDSGELPADAPAAAH